MPVHAPLRSKSDQARNNARVPHRSSADAPAGPLQALFDSSLRVTQLRTQSALLNRDRADTRKFAGSGKGVVQAYSIKRAASGALYSVSDDKSTVTGMLTPNHQLYVDDASKIGKINAAAKQSMLNFKDGGKAKLFARDYTRVQAGFKKVSFQGPKHGFFGGTTHNVDIGKQYRGKVAPAAAAQNMAKYDEAVNTIMQTNWKNSYGQIKNILKTMTQATELFKKLVIANQAKEGFHEVVNQMQAPSEMVHAMEALIYARQATPELAGQTQLKLAGELETIISDFANDRHVQAVATDLVSFAGDLGKVLPKGVPVNLILVHSVNYREAMAQSIKLKDPLFYRACDVMAATVLGNKLTAQNEGQLNVYSAEDRTGAFHYAARILSVGPDWVSLESFAAGERERDILGLDPAGSLTNIDNSWQYLMYGSVKKRGQTGGEQDNAFELYTKLRYYLKGIKNGEGSFRTDQRDRLHSPIPGDAFTAISGIDGQASDRIWESLRKSGVFDDNGNVKNPGYLTTSYVSLRLGEQDRDKAAAISGRLTTLYNTPSSNLRHVQRTGNAEFRNIAAWIKLQNLDLDPVALEGQLQDSLAGGNDPLLLHNKGWIKLLLAMGN